MSATDLSHPASSCEGMVSDPRHSNAGWRDPAEALEADGTPTHGPRYAPRTGTGRDPGSIFLDSKLFPPFSLST